MSIHRPTDELAREPIRFAVPSENETPLPRSPWRKRSLFVLAGVAILVSAITLISSTVKSGNARPRLVYKVVHGNVTVTVLEEGLLESSDNAEIKCRVRGNNTVLWVVESGTVVEPGDELLRLDTLFIDEQINERTKYAHWSRSAAERSAANVTRSELAVDEYERGRYPAEVMKLEKDLAVAEATLLSAKNMLVYKKMMADRGYANSLEVEEREYALSQAKLAVELKRTEIDVLKKFTKAEQSETLVGNLAATKANHEANAERAVADASRRDRALEEAKYTTVRAKRGGLVIHPNAARWRNAPPIAPGINVWKDQVLLLMPDLTKMQVKIGIHEDAVKRVVPGLPVRVKIPGRTLIGKVKSVASVTRPATWWNGNAVRYDAFIELPPEPGLRPGMSAEVEIVVAEHKNVISIPVACIVETPTGSFCLVATPNGPERRALELGDTNTVHTVVMKGLALGEEVVLNPGAYIDIKALSKKSDKEGDPKKRERKPKPTSPTKP